MQIRILENIQQKIFMRSSFEFAYRFPKIKMSELRNYYPPELANRFFDTLTVQKGLSKVLIDFPAAALQIIFGLLLLSFYHPFFIIYGILLLGLIYVVFKYTARRGLETSLEESQAKYKEQQKKRKMSQNMSLLSKIKRGKFITSRDEENMRAEKTTLYQLLAEHLETFLERCREDGFQVSVAVVDR